MKKIQRTSFSVVENSIDAGATKIEIRTHCFSRRVKIEIVDNGDGISKENLKRVSIKDVVLNKRNIFTGKYQLKS